MPDSEQNVVAPEELKSETAIAVAELKSDLEVFTRRLSDLERRVGKVEPMVMDLRIEVQDLMEQVSRGTRISLETQGEMREAFRSLQRQNDLILQKLGLTEAERARATAAVIPETK